MTPVVLVAFSFFECNQLPPSTEKNCQRPLVGLGWSATWRMNNLVLTSQTVCLVHIVWTEWMQGRKQKKVWQKAQAGVCVVEALDGL